MALSPGLPGWASTRRNTHPLTLILIIKHCLSTFSLYCCPEHPSCSIYVLDTLFQQPVSRSSLVYPLVWNPCFILHAFLHPVIFFSQHMPVPSQPVPRLYSLFLISLSQLLTWKSVFYLTHPSDYSDLCSLKCHLVFFLYGPGITSMQQVTTLYLHTFNVVWYLLFITLKLKIYTYWLNGSVADVS